MNDLIEVAKLPKGIEGFLSEFKPVRKLKWVNLNGKYDYVIDNTAETQDEIKVGFDRFISAVRDVYTFGESIYKGTPKFCLSLQRIYSGLSYVEDCDNPGCSYNKALGVKPAMSDYSHIGENFKSIVGRLGVSETAAYRYKDLANFVDPKTEDFYSEFKGYSISLLSEIWTLASALYSTSISDLKKMAKLITATTTIDDIRLYRKARKELNCWGASLFKDYSYNQRYELEKKPLSEVLKVYNDLVQKAEAKKLEETMSGVQKVAQKDKSVKVLPATDEMIVKKAEYQKINDLAQKAVNIGVCDGCKFKDVNLNKCRCCRRYESLKDLFEAN